MLIGVKDSQSDLEKHYKTFCGLYVRSGLFDVLGLALAEYKKSPQFIEIVDFVAFRLSVVLESQRCVRDSNP